MGKKFLVITPKNGLCNQLLSITKGIILGIISNRDIVFNSFQLDYKNHNNICDFDRVIDLPHLRNILSNLKIDMALYSNLNIKGTLLNKGSDNDIQIMHIKDLIPLILNDVNKDIEYLNIDSPITAEIPKEYSNIHTAINLNIKFTDYYIGKANEIKMRLNMPDTYTCVHLRLENDAINFMKDHNNKLDFNMINEIYKSKYTEEFEALKESNKKIYVCTSLGMNNHVNNDFYNELKEKYSILDKNDIIKVYDSNCREIYGIIDFIIAKDSSKFIGCDWSSFSIYIHESHYYSKKETKLIDIWSTIIKR